MFLYILIDDLQYQVCKQKTVLAKIINTNLIYNYRLGSAVHILLISHIIITHILNVYFPCLHGLDEFLNNMDIFHSFPFCARSLSIFRDLKSLSTTFIVQNIFCFRPNLI